MLGDEKGVVDRVGRIRERTRREEEDLVQTIMLRALAQSHRTHTTRYLNQTTKTG